MVEIRKPSITGKTDAEKTAQIIKYLYQLVEELNYRITTIEAEVERLAASQQNN